MRSLLLLIPALLVGACGAALAQDAAAPVASDAGAVALVRELGPVGSFVFALLYGVFQIGKTFGALTEGLTKFAAVASTAIEKGIPIRVELSKEDRELLEGVAALPPRRRAGGGS